MKPFHFQKFSISQNREVFRVGTDAVLLGVLVQVESKGKVLEVGSGTGIISLMVAQRNEEAEILAIDINPKATELSAENFQNSPFRERMSAKCCDFKTLENTVQYDLIISNPPYFEENQSEKDVLARQKVELDFSILIERSSKMITEKGVFAVIIPFADGVSFISKAEEFGFYLIRKVEIFGIKNLKPKRLVLEFSKTNFPLKTEGLVIEKEPRVYSSEYLELTKDFHIFGGKR